MNQLLLGAAIPFALGLLVYAVRGFRATLAMLIGIPAAMACGAVWAVIPDVPRLAGRQELYRQLAADPRCDLFLWHYTIDAPWYLAVYLALWVLMAFGLYAAAWREVRRAEEA
jgi:hypothetical protein